MTYTHPFPLPEGNQGAWSKKDWQAAANFYWYEIAGVDKADPNHQPVLSILKDAHSHAQRKVRGMK